LAALSNQQAQVKIGSQYFPFSDVKNAISEDVSVQYSINYANFVFPLITRKEKEQFF